MLGRFLGLDGELVEVMWWLEDDGEASLVDVAEGGPDEEVKLAGEWRICASADLVSGRDSMVRTKNCDRSFIEQQIAQGGNVNGSRSLPSTLYG